MKRLHMICILLALGTAALAAQNWKARLASTLPAADPFIVQNGPTNWAVEWVDIGTNTTAAPPYIFVGDDAARAAFIAARVLTWSNWNANTGGQFRVTLDRSNDVFQITNNIGLLQQFFDGNRAFLTNVNLGNPIDSVALSNATVRQARILKQLEIILKNNYQGQ